MGKGGQHNATELAPGLYYGPPIGEAAVESNVTLSNGTRILFSSRGGSRRLWDAQGWLQLCDVWKVILA